MYPYINQRPTLLGKLQLFSSSLPVSNSSPYPPSRPRVGLCTPLHTHGSNIDTITCAVTDTYLLSLTPLDIHSMPLYTTDALNYGAHQMNITSLEALQESMPRGIKVTWANGKIRYTVRASKNGKKESLGTFICQKLAIETLTRFKMGTPIKLSQEEMAQIVSEETDKEVRRMWAAEEKEKSKTPREVMLAILASVPTHLLDSKKPYYHMEDDGRTVVIPAALVEEYFNSVMYLADVPDEDISDQPPSADEQVINDFFRKKRPTDASDL